MYLSYLSYPFSTFQGKTYNELSLRSPFIITTVEQTTSVFPFLPLIEACFRLKMSHVIIQDCEESKNVTKRIVNHYK